MPAVTLLVTKRAVLSTYLCFLAQVICPGPPKSSKVDMKHATGIQPHREKGGLSEAARGPAEGRMRREGIGG